MKCNLLTNVRKRTRGPGQRVESATWSVSLPTRALQTALARRSGAR